MSDRWLDEFRPFTLQHAVVAGVCIGGMVLLAWVGRRWRGTARERALGAAMGWLGLIAWVVQQALWMLPGHFDVRESLPLHICDLAGVLAPIALLRPARLLRAILFFWALGLSTQGFFTPVLTEGMAHFKFWAFWGGHTIVVGYAVYDAAARGFRPTWRECWQMAALTAAYIGAMVAINIALSSNYAYVGDTSPENPTIVDALGPWPARVPLIMGLGMVACLGAWGAVAGVDALAARVRAWRSIRTF